jgi:hypothetical protein
MGIYRIGVHFGMVKCQLYGRVLEASTVIMGYCCADELPAFRRDVHQHLSRPETRLHQRAPRTQLVSQRSLPFCCLNASFAYALLCPIQHQPHRSSATAGAVNQFFTAHLPTDCRENARLQRRAARALPVHHFDFGRCSSWNLCLGAARSPWSHHQPRGGQHGALALSVARPAAQSAI